MRFQSFQARLFLLALATTFCPSAVLAADGAIEINDAKVKKNNGYPFAISQPGIYRLTSNLSVPSNVDGIDINSSDVSLDLNGFEIVGPVSCVPTCPAPSLVDGIQSGGSHIRVRNGTVRGFGGFGVFFLNPDIRLDHLYVTSNARGGISAGNRTVVEDSIAFQNGGAGISVGSDSLVQRSISIGNVSAGISTAGPTVVVGNSVSSNGGNGIDAAVGSVIRDNAAVGNADGISASGGLVTQNAVGQNGGNGIRVFVGGLANQNVADSNGASGIVADSGSSVQGNTAYNNALDGFNFRLENGTDPPGYSENVLTGNDTSGNPPPDGNVVQGLPLLPNSCNGIPSC